MMETILGIVGVIGSWGIWQVMLSRDAEAITKCRQLCFGLKENLEDFAENLLNPTRNPEKDLPRLKEIKKIMENLCVAKEGLTFPSYDLNALLDQSFSLFPRLRMKDGNAANQPHFIASELNVLWGMELVRPFHFSKLAKIQKFLHQSFLGRFGSWGLAWIKK